MMERQQNNFNCWNIIRSSNERSSVEYWNICFTEL